jgi:hypothetical protein
MASQHVTPPSASHAAHGSATASDTNFFARPGEPDWSAGQPCDPCGLDLAFAPRTSRFRLTPTVIRAIEDMVTSPDYRHVPTATLAVLAQRLGKVWTSPSTWYRLVRQHGWRGPRLRVPPAKPKQGFAQRARTRCGTSTLRSSACSTEPRLSPCRDRQFLATHLGRASAKPRADDTSRAQPACCGGAYRLGRCRPQSSPGGRTDARRARAPLSLLGKCRYTVACRFRTLRQPLDRHRLVPEPRQPAIDGVENGFTNVVRIIVPRMCVRVYEALLKLPVRCSELDLDLASLNVFASHRSISGQIGEASRLWPNPANTTCVYGFPDAIDDGRSPP